MSNDMKAYHFLYRGGFLTLFFYLRLMPLFAQEKPENKLVTLKMENKSFKKVCNAIERQVKYYFAGDEIQYDRDQKVSVNFVNTPLHIVLDTLLKGKGVTWSINSKSIVLRKTAEIIPVTNENDSITVTGRVFDEKDLGLPGATVMEDNTLRGTTTNQYGQFTFRVSKTATLKVTYVGCKEYTEKVAGKSNFLITLFSVESPLKETVVTGYGMDDKRLLTGGISRVKGEIIGSQPVLNSFQAIQGRVPGVQITQNTGIPGGGFDIHVRGQNSLRMVNNPFYIIDGIPYIAEPLNIPGVSLYPAITNNPYNGMSPLNYINPEDIASIEILKDGDATAIYGSRSANGVILITTKKADSSMAKKGNPITSWKNSLRITACVYGGGGKVAHTMKLLNTPQYLAMRLEGIKNDKTTMKRYDYDTNNEWDTTRNTDWQKELIGRIVHINNEFVTVSAGSKYTQGLITFGNYRQTMPFPGENLFDRTSIHGNLNTIPSGKGIKVNISFNYSNGKTKSIGQDLTQIALNLAPDAPRLYDSLNNINWQHNTFSNPALFTKRPYVGNTSNLIAAGQFSYQLNEWISFSSNLGFVMSSVREKSKRFRTSFNPDVAPLMPLSATYGHSKVHSWIAEPQVNYKTAIGKGTLTGLLGTTYQYEVTDHLKQTASGFQTEEQMDDIRNAIQTTIVPTYQYAEYKYAALFGRIKYEWDRKYILNVSGRIDASSRFGANNQVAEFMAVGAAWIFSGTNFIKNDLLFLNFGKLRVSYGSTGSDQISNYEYLDGYTTLDGTSYQGVSAIVPSRPANPDFRWEVTKKLEAALEFELFGKRISGTVEFYRNRSSNLLVSYPLPPTAGFPSVQYNLKAVIENKGLEAELTSVNIKLAPFTWTSSFNLTIPQNKLISFPGLANSSYANQYVIGEPVSILKLYHYQGVDPVTGLYKVEDIHSDGVFDVKDQQSVKNLKPVLYGGLQNGFDYKLFHLDFFLYFVKQLGYNYRYNMGLPGQFNQNQPVSVLDRWRAAGDNASVQQFSSAVNTVAVQSYDRYKNSDILVSDASFVRLKSVNLSFQFPENWKPKKVNTVSIFLQGQNLLTITGYEGLDAETQNNGLPPLRTFTAGINITL
ncbi:SusC/RagA family TonB-linked outer membrane protein [Chitinophaga oryziterrae]|uniref:SusC/RagA family TonB-linked outer membrane protein n=1 Tax=Chitinophaga oryziterrae TaxID=1031224 RepID=A0A6N8J9W2_9BACT|nr:SusC/RagA family TonB-linked outer membrane protein [Chitinophaga oryziterrae]MVT42020.1 SusC/RagA family TonB-linked outer membrane protein [Chitinophaga oryziterrae]